MPPTEDEITWAVAKLRASRDASRRPERRRGDGCRAATVVGSVMIGSLIGATTVLAGIDAGLLMTTAAAATSKYAAEIARSATFAAIGVVVAIAKTLQAYSDGYRLSLRVTAVNVGVSVLFAIAGGVVADGAGVAPKLALGAAFVCGALGFGSLRIIEERLKR